MMMRIREGQPAVDSLDDMLKERDAILEELQLNLMLAQQIMESNADRKRRDDSFEVGDLVCLKLQPYRHRSLARKPLERLAAKFYGPFMVLRRGKCKSPYGPRSSVSCPTKGGR